MHEIFVHDALPGMALSEDMNAPGEAIIETLHAMGEQQPRCNTRASRAWCRVSLRILFTAAPVNKEAVRHSIDHALMAGRAPGRKESTTRWTLLCSGPGTLKPTEKQKAQDLLPSGQH